MTGNCTTSCVTAWMIPHYLEVSSSFPLAAELQDSWGSGAWREQGTSDLLLLLRSCQFCAGDWDHYFSLLKAFSRVGFTPDHPSVLQLLTLRPRAASALADKQMMTSTNKIF